MCGTDRASDRAIDAAGIDRVVETFARVRLVSSSATDVVERERGGAVGVVLRPRDGGDDDVVGVRRGRGVRARGAGRLGCAGDRPSEKRAGAGENDRCGGKRGGAVRGDRVRVRDDGVRERKRAKRKGCVERGARGVGGGRRRRDEKRVDDARGERGGGVRGGVDGVGREREEDWARGRV